jgi:hypothetical protein
MQSSNRAALIAILLGDTRRYRTISVAISLRLRPAVCGSASPWQKAKRATPGSGPEGDERYKACFRTPPCAACKREGPNEAAHGEDGGMRMKGSDKSCIPLCTRAAASDRARATAFSHNMRSALVLPRTIAPRTPCTGSRARAY